MNNFCCRGSSIVFNSNLGIFFGMRDWCPMRGAGCCFSAGCHSCAPFTCQHSRGDFSLWMPLTYFPQHLPAASPESQQHEGPHPVPAAAGNHSGVVLWLVFFGYTFTALVNRSLPALSPSVARCWQARHSPALLSHAPSAPGSLFLSLRHGFTYLAYGHPQVSSLPNVAVIFLGKD